MCGIFTYIGKSLTWSDLEKDFKKINYRGPDNSSVKKNWRQCFIFFSQTSYNGN